MKKISFSLMLMFLFCYNVYGNQDSYQSLGVALSSYSGSGLSYRYHFENRWALQLTGGAIVGDEEKYYATGLELQSDLTSIKDKRMYLILSFGWYGETEEVFTNGGGMYGREEVDINYYKVAIGFGGELAFGNSLVDNLSLGLAIFPIGLSVKEKHSYPEYDDTNSVSFGASLFTHFNF